MAQFETASPPSGGRFAKICGHTGMLQFDHGLLPKKRETLFWFRVWNSRGVEERLLPLISVEPAAVIKKSAELVVSLSILIDVDRHEVFKSSHVQIM